MAHLVEVATNTITSAVRIQSRAKIRRLHLKDENKEKTDRDGNVLQKTEKELNHFIIVGHRLDENWPRRSISVRPFGNLLYFINTCKA